MAKCRVGLLFGGCSGEHEVSICSAQAIAGALSRGHNQGKYAVVPVYITKAGVWRFGDEAAGVLQSGQALAAEGTVTAASRLPDRSEERRVGEEGRSRWSPEH